MSHSTALLLVHADGSPVSTPFTLGPLSAGDPFAAGRETAFVGADGIAAGIVNASAASSSEQYPFTEMLVVHRGRITLQAKGETLQAGPGESLVIERGLAVQIAVEPNSLWAFCAATQAEDSPHPALVWIERRAALSPSAAPEASILIGATPQCRSHNAFEDQRSPLRIGVWDSTPYARGGRPHKVHELMHLIEGQVLLKGSDGSVLTVKTGDTVFVPQGAPCAWESTVYVRKYYAVA